ncbi:MAG TPA: hypothetical protein VM030_08790 [Acidimicrobiales bacterium]|nr:hypothetical protein [Acidimicrobiales bacterium]
MAAALRDDPVLLTLSIVRLSAVIAGWYVVGLALLGAAAGAARLPLLTRGAAALSPRFSRRLAEVLTTLVFLGGPLSTSARADSASTADDLPVMRWLPPESTTTTSTTTATAATALPGATGTAPAVRVVTPGDHFWSLAEATVAARLGRAPTAQEIAPYWRRLIESNRDRLVHRGNPDLIYAGQEMAMPPGD